MSTIVMPDRLAQRPRHGEFPILFTTLLQGGKPDFRISDMQRVGEAFNKRLCGICGQPLVGPVFLASFHIAQGERISPEPPSHEDCIRYALAVCPYLLGNRERREGNKPDGVIPGLYHAAARPKTMWLAWTPGYTLTLQAGIWYARCEPWTRLEAV